MAIVLHRPDLADLGTPTPKPTSTGVGQLEAALLVWEGADGVETGIWEAGAGTFTARRDGYHEVCQILSGSATVTETGGSPVPVGPGDTLITPAGWTGVWDVHETLRKTYVIVPVPGAR